MAARAFNESPANSQAQICSFASVVFQTRTTDHGRKRTCSSPAWKSAFKPAQSWLCSSNKPVPGMTPRPASFGQSGEDMWLNSSGSRLDRAQRACVFRTTGQKVFQTVFALWLTTSLLARAGSTKGISFRNDVMAVLSKAGCNAGQCHGNANGKASFKLSLRGESPDLDFLALTHDQFNRRVDLLEPDQSLILLKPTTQVSHEGGQRFNTNSWEYETLFKWIAAGASNDHAVPSLTSPEVTPTESILNEPINQTQITTKANFSDSTVRDVTSIAVYE